MFDGALGFGHGSLIDTQLGNLHHVVTSFITDRQTINNRLVSKRKIKITTVEMAIKMCEAAFKSI